jgi:hypothetical protein
MSETRAPRSRRLHSHAGTGSRLLTGDVMSNPNPQTLPVGRIAIAMLVMLLAGCAFQATNELQHSTEEEGRVTGDQRVASLIELAGSRAEPEDTRLDNELFQLMLKMSEQRAGIEAVLERETWDWQQLETFSELLSDYAKLGSMATASGRTVTLDFEVTERTSKPSDDELVFRQPTGRQDPITGAPIEDIVYYYYSPRLTPESYKTYITWIDRLQGLTLELEATIEARKVADTIRSLDKVSKSCTECHFRLFNEGLGMDEWLTSEGASAYVFGVAPMAPKR